MSARKYSARLLGKSEYWGNIGCASACPIGTVAGKYASAIAEGEYGEGYRVAAAANPLVSVCAHVCAHPCEKGCRRGSVDEPVSIRALKRFLVDRSGHDGQGNRSRAMASNGRKVAIVGSGPAGLAAAHDLAIMGYPVTVLERQSFAGGMMRRGIPLYRLPRAVIQSDVDRIVALGVEIRLEVEFGRDFDVDTLKNDGYEAIFIAMGLPLCRNLPIEGMDLDGVLSGIDFLDAVNAGQPPLLGGDVLVIGGGNVAFDVARSAQRVLKSNGYPSRTALAPKLNVLVANGGVPQVRLVSLESTSEMPADPEEVREAQREGVSVHPSRGPKRILGKDGSVIGLETLEVSSVFDADGRFNPSFVDGSESIIPADIIILAIGQMADLTCLQREKGIALTNRGMIQVDPETLATSMDGVFAGGDVACGPRAIVDAMASGRQAARSIHRFLSGGEASHSIGRMTVVDHRMRDDFDRLPRHEVPLLAPRAREGFAPVEVGYDEATAIAEARRCLKCFVNPVFDSHKCISCGGCVDVCPQNCLRLVRTNQLRPDGKVAMALEARYRMPLPEIVAADFQGMAILKEEERCVRCGLCARRCPVKAITMETFEPTEVGNG